MQELDTLDDMIKRCSTLFLAGDVELSLLLLQSMIDSSSLQNKYAIGTYLSFIADELVMHAIKTSDISSDDEYGLEFFEGSTRHYVYNDYHYDIGDCYDYCTEFHDKLRKITHESISVALTIWFNTSYRLVLALEIMRSNDLYLQEMNLHHCSYVIQQDDITTTVTGETFENNIILFLKHINNETIF